MSAPHDPASGRSRRVAYALIPGQEEIAYLAEDSEVLTRVVVLQLVAQLRPDHLPQNDLERIRTALRDEDWEEAIVAWMDTTGQRLNIFPDEPVWTSSVLDEEQLRFELPHAPIFTDPAEH